MSDSHETLPYTRVVVTKKEYTTLALAHNVPANIRDNFIPAYLDDVGAVIALQTKHDEKFNDTRKV